MRLIGISGVALLTASPARAAFYHFEPWFTVGPLFWMLAIAAVVIAGLFTSGKGDGTGWWGSDSDGGSDCGGGDGGGD